LKDENGAQKLTFEVRYNDFKGKASLIELPTIIESHKTIDFINIFKSNDISQMIYVHNQGEKEVPESLAKKVEQINDFS